MAQLLVNVSKPGTVQSPQGVNANGCHNTAGQKRSARKERERCAALAREWDEKVDRTSEHADSPRMA